MASNQWKWQEPGTVWKGVGIYHVTMTVPSREPLLGTLQIPDNDPKQAFVERTDLGKEIVYLIGSIPNYRPQIRLLQYCLMPDHVHFIVHVQQQMPYSIKAAIRGFWQAAKKAGREYILSISPNDIRNNEQNTPSPIFTEIPFIRPLSRSGQLQTMYDYVRMNPQRLATKHLMPGFFRVQEDINVAGRTYSAVGNTKLLLSDRFETVHVRHDLLNLAATGNEQPLRDYMNGCILAARQGAVMVSPFISEKEKEVQTVLLAEEHPIILLADNGFRDYYKPSAGLFDSVAAGNVLILSPWPYDPQKKRVSRSECVAMNGMAEEIANLHF
jgi:REP element-mobilizing transposase RayT